MSETEKLEARIKDLEERLLECADFLRIEINGHAHAQERIKELEDHLGERNKAEVWASTNVVLAGKWNQ